MFEPVTGTFVCYLKLYVVNELEDDVSSIALCYLLPPIRVVYR